MKELDIAALKKMQLQMLDVFAAFCKKHSLDYWIDGGSLLGAIRHKGYIPWDDDIDAGMLRPDYDRCMALFNQEHDRYRFYSVENNRQMHYAIGKILDTNTVLYEPNPKGNKLCVYIDIFVYDNAPDDDKEVRKMYQHQLLLMKLNRLQLPYHPAGSVFRKAALYLLKGILKAVPRYYFTERIIKNAKKYAAAETKRVGNFTGTTQVTVDKRVFDDFIEVEFEGSYYKAPAGYDEWLRAFYGNYMELPPLGERKPHHLFEAYMLDEKEDSRI